MGTIAWPVEFAPKNLHCQMSRSDGVIKAFGMINGLWMPSDYGSMMK
jgi:hypothetical protein